MTQVLERPLAPAVPRTALELHEELQQRLRVLGPDPERELGLVQPGLVELEHTGRHRLLIANETLQPTNAFKANGFAVAVRAALAQNPDIQTFYTGTAGNAGAAVAWAAQALGRKAALLTPRSLTAGKRTTMQAYGGDIDASYPTVSDAIEAAVLRAAADPYGAFLSPFDNLDAITGQALVGRRIARELLAREVQGPVEVLIQRGGGSLLTGIASALYAAPLSGLRVHEVRPERAEDGALDTLYDGLAVEEPGVYAATMLADSRFVHGSVQVSRAETGRAALRIARSRAFLGERFEPSGLVGVAAFEQRAARSTTPTTYVAVLSGANTSAETFAALTDAPRLTERQRMQSLGNTGLQGTGATLESPSSVHGHHTLVASSPTAQFRATR